jgi:phosphoserine phosphatase
MPFPESPQLEALIGRHADAARPPVAVFDCDGTIIRGDIGESMFYYQIERFLFRANPANIWLDYPRREELDTLFTELSALPAERRTNDRRFVSFAEMLLGWYFDQLREGKTEKACSDIVRLFAKFSEQEVEDIAAETFRNELASPLAVKTFGRYAVPVGIRYIDEAVALLRTLQSAGFEIWAVSGSNVWSVRQVFEPLGIPRERIIGIDLQKSSNLFTAKVRTPVPVLEGKVEALRASGAAQPVIVVSDSIYDLPLFAYAAELKVLINSRMETSYTFFKEANLVKDERWIVVERPTDLAHPLSLNERYA